MYDKFKNDDPLTPFEKSIYKIISSISLVGALICFFFILKTKDVSLQRFLFLVELCVFGVSLVFGYALKWGTRVLDLRKFKK